ncbi:putative glutathione S-transferase [Aliiroseovarius crassostreae]|uniref:Glutathionyl-hydroquinone reductase YqjG n=1 Tax=Aliiroseovarius crassostreae TaxID=154981 RepID=A0A0P7J1T8_9RHOB|nr:glutathione S-transferase family protein [Aliiroseovarius crassostreae]KPN61583.1 glutathionyl-hydroquinone reductase YqjG [Aliiroseovarius crassostreae]SFU57038.1 putative glutathione S-transferase [Aliiroseovarius crassostreae]
MGQLVNGKWEDVWYDTKSTKGKFRRSEAQFRNWITRDGSAGPSGKDGFKAEQGRYHLFVSLACPWAHRTLIFRKLKGLEGLIDVTVVSPDMLSNGWEFDPDSGGDPLFGHAYLHQLYTQAIPNYSGRVTVPVLWDKQTQMVVSNESSEIIRMFNSAFDEITGNTLDFYPETLRDQIDEGNEFVYSSINNGVYKCGFATTQEAYEHAFDALFAALDQIEDRLSRHRYLVGNTLTEGDWRLFPTLIRFDAVYHGHFKTNLKRIEDYPNISNYLRDLYQHSGVADTVDFHQIKRHYYASHETINPTRIVPKGPAQDFTRPHDRTRFEVGV